MAERKSIAHSFDCDGVLVWRIPVQTDVIKFKHKPYRVPNELPLLDREVDETPLSRWDFNYGFHAVRGVTRLASRAIIAISRGDIYLNTGRENRRAYVDLTERALERGGIRNRFKDLFFGVKDLSAPILTRGVTSESHPNLIVARNILEAVRLARS